MLRLLQDNGGRERYSLLGSCAVYVGRYRQVLVIARVFEEWVGVVAVRQRKAKAVRGQMRFDGAHQVVDRIGLVPRDRRSCRLQAGDSHAVLDPGDPDDLI